MKFNVFITIFSVFIVLTLLVSFLSLSSCSKNDDYDSFSKDSIADIDGNIVSIVKIGNRWWMAENLTVKRYRNGDSINYVKDPLADSKNWAKTKTGAFTLVEKKIVFYNWHVINDPRNIAPQGWHIPSDEEWKELEVSLGMHKDTVVKSNFRGPNIANKFRDKKIFSAQVDGCIMFNGLPGVPGTGANGFWWTATEKDTSAWFRYIDHNKNNVFRYFGPKTYGFSIRCVKDN